MTATGMKYNSKAIRLSDVIVRNIWEGQFDGAKYLPGEDALARKYEVSRTTIRRVLDILNREGVLIKKPNRGSLINPDLRAQSSSMEVLLSILCRWRRSHWGQFGLVFPMR